MADSSLPLWFKPELFLAPEFNPAAYVADLKRYVPLETLSTELHSHLNALKNKLVEVINDDYTDFVSLSTKLVNVDGSLARMQRPLLELQEKLESARGGIAGAAAELQSGLARRQAVAAARALLELMQDTAHVMSKVDKLLGEVCASGAASAASGGPAAGTSAAAAAKGVAVGASSAAASLAPEELEARCRLLDRVASEVSRLQFYSAKGDELEFMRQLRPRIKAAAEALQGYLDEALAATLQSQSPVALSVCLHAYAAIARPQAAEAVVRATLVAPVVQRAMAHQKAAAPLSGPAAAGPQLGAVLGAVSEGLNAQCAPFLEHTLSQASTSQAFDFLGGALLAEVHAALEESLPGVFSAGVPANFHANFLAATSFIEGLEGYCTTAAQVEAFRGSAAAAAFWKRWNLPVYFSLRFQDIAGSLEGKLPGTVLQPAAAAPAATSNGGAADPPLHWAPSAAVWAGLQRCIASDVFLPHLADKFVRLALQLLARYAAWIDGYMRQRAEAAATAAAGGGEQQGGAAPAGAQQRQQATAGAAQQQQGDGGSGGGWEAAATPEQLAALRQDIDSLCEGLLSAYIPQLSQRLGGQGAEAAEAVASAFSEAAEQLEGAGGALMGAVAESLVDKSVVVLKQLRGIVATFRMTSRAQPSRPSHYVSMILAPLQAFLQTEAAAKLSGEARQQLATAVAAGVGARYLHLADDTLSTVRKTESSLKRLKARQQGGEGGAAPDTDKMIALQLFLDVQEFGRQAKQAGVDAAQLESYQQLWRLVVPEDQADAAIAF
ncbi:conserved oligomeric Golgi complex subunit 2 [Micractinium conductrix]|uniref:Conserved oligomeric Golgi complex subunit 2 n=1 Tax=Micractinium conductrix TaxID=554055 RepID=A0A2P6VNR4_9CHLO|nr:conserved oligomeric Golgi complex subunit 2 [Micractinium conductrix]|eukprot:PSC75738.1 conserved oligomeric Golgi complex subunit 2 [Micractinium conductrix]